MNVSNSKRDVIIICGPTGVGKTTVGIELAKRFNGEIVSADSMQIYRHMNIGTAKPTKAERAEVKHHMIDIIDPDEPFDAEMYSKMAREKINTLSSNGLFPFVVGGTGFYIKALEHGLFDPGLSDPDTREHLKKEIEAYGIRFLYERLSQCDPKTAAIVHPNDTYRIVRALEVYQLTGKGISTYRTQHGFSDTPFRTLKVGLKMERKKLYARINERVDRMIEAGFVDEVRNLLNKGYHANWKSMQSIGYRHMVNFIEGRISLEETVRTMKRDTRRYAKRQFTWFNADASVKWMEPGDLKDIRKIAEHFLKLQ